MKEPLQLSEEPARDARYRIEMTVSCRDSDFIPKVADAGCVRDENGTRVQIMHNGLRVVADGYAGSWMTEVITRLRGHHEPQEEALFHEVLRHVPPNGTMIELGGYWAYYSMWFLQGAPNTRRSIVIEPNPKHLDVGRRNATLNGLQMEFRQAYLGDSLDSSISSDVQSISVPELFIQYGIDTLDILHCDIQGAETSVLQSCSQLIRDRKIRFLVVSTHSHQISKDPLTHQRCIALLKNANAQILAEHDVHESFSGDGLIVAYAGADVIDFELPKLSLNRYSTSLFRNPLYDLHDALLADRANAETEPSKRSKSYPGLDWIASKLKRKS